MGNSRDNLPPGVSMNTPGAPWNDPDPVECRECGEDVMPSTRCECGEMALSEEEANWEAAEAAAEARYEMMKEDGRDDF